MGVRFACHACGKPLHVKAELAGKRGICPQCDARFRIPSRDSDYSARLEGDPSGRAAGSSADPANPNPAKADPAKADHAKADHAKADPAKADHAKAVPANTDHGPGVPTKSEPEVHPGRAAGLLESEPESVWYVRPSSGGQYGPATSELLKRWIEEQRVASTALLWREGWPQWRVASEALPEWADRLPGPSDGTEDGAVANDGSVADAATAALPSPTDAESAVRPGDRGEARIQGRWDVATARRGRLTRRTLAVGLLLAISIVLIVVLSLVAFGPSMFTTGDQP